MTYVNRQTGAVISEDAYRQLSSIAKSNYVENRPSNTSSSSNGLVDFGLSVAIGAVTDSAILGGVLGGDILGGIVGDSLDGDLWD